MSHSAPFAEVECLISLAISGGYLFAGTEWNGVWRRPLSEMIPSAVQKYNQPSAFHLNQNYPNPFSESTSIPFDIPERSFVKLILYDITGREVKTLVNEILDVGSYSRPFEAQELSAGMYFCRLDAGKYKEIKAILHE